MAVLHRFYCIKVIYSRVTHCQVSASGSYGSILIHITRLYHECDGGIGKSVLRITVWHHEACRGGDSAVIDLVFVVGPLLCVGFLC